MSDHPSPDPLPEVKCYLCPAPATEIMIWRPSARQCRNLGSLPGGLQEHTIPLCAGCKADPKLPDRLMARSLLDHRDTVEGN